jgi:hypothetical protein
MFTSYHSIGAVECHTVSDGDLWVKALITAEKL